MMNPEARIISDGADRFFVEWSRRPSSVTLNEVLEFARLANGKGIHLVIDASYGPMTAGALDLHAKFEAEGIVHEVIE